MIQKKRNIIILFVMLTCALQAQTDTIVNQRRGATQISKDTTLAKIPGLLVVPDTSKVSDTLALADSLVHRPNALVRYFKKGYPNPRKAMLFSLIIPGAGQAYNRKWWKIPIIYGALGGIGYVEYNNINTYRLYRDSYKALVDENPLTVVTDPKLLLQDKTTMKANRDITRKNLEQSSLILGLAYILSITDAFVDAHLHTFDVSDDLSLHFCPKNESVYGFGLAFGVGMSVVF